MHHKRRRQRNRRAGCKLCKLWRAKVEVKAMKDQDRRIAEELRQRLGQVVPLLDFVVFGSRARGDAGEHSDLDVFVEVESLDRESRERIFDVTWEIGL